jgi:class 3 adenylate cyclase/tetratricopeptide (TPR) repeat protein
MRCPHCAADNREGRRYCSKCGAALPRACAACGFVNEPDDQFCGGCGRAFADEPSPARSVDYAAAGERRQVTILFADLTGFTRMTSDLGAETTHRMLNRYLSTLDELVGNYGGSVEYIGDAVMAMFGAPVAHSDDPLRAVRAAVEMHQAMDVLSAELGRKLQVHIGVASGEVVAAGLGRDGKTKYTAIGESVNLASRLNHLAAPGETLISDAMQRAVSHQVPCEPAGEAAVKGFDHPVRVWRIVGRIESGYPQFDTPFVGRQAELRQFAGILDACRETRSGQAVLLRGEAGIGKTRLAAEFASLAGARGFACHKGLVLDFGTGKGQDAVGALTRSLLGIPLGTGKEIRTQQADAGVAAGLVEPSQRAFLNDLLDVPQPADLRALFDAMDGATRQRGREAVLGSLVRRSTARAPVLLLVEDIHWADTATLAMIAALVRTVGDCAGVLALTSRIDGDPVDAAWRAQAGNGALTIIDLAALRPQEAQAMAAGLVVQDAGLIANCIERAEGNPLFLEQLLRNSEESAGAAMPGSIQSLVLARMDRLSPPDKHALQAAAVIGQRFTLDALRAVVGDERYDAAALLRHRLIRPEAHGYLFSHALIRDGVYGSLLSDARRELHRRAAGYFDRRDAMLRAQHLDLADDPGAPAAYLDAARSLAASYSNDQALQLVERGAVIAKAPVEQFALINLKGELLHDLGAIPEAVAAHEAALAIAPDDLARCGAWLGIAAGMRMLDRIDEALTLLERTEAVATAQGFAGDLARIHHLRGNLFFPMGRIDDCLAQHQLALRYARESESVEAEARALGGLGDAEYARGRMAAAKDNFQRCIELARRHGFGRIEVANRGMVAFSRAFCGDLAGAREDALEAIRMAARVGHQRAELMGEMVMYFITYETCEWEAAKGHIDRARTLTQRLGARRFEAQNLLRLAQMLSDEGRRDDALALLQEALAISRETGIGFAGPRVLSAIALLTDDPIQRAQAMSEALTLLHNGSLAHNHFFVRRDAMEIGLRDRDWAAVEEHAAVLAAFAAAEPNAWTDFFVARGRALAAHGRRQNDEAVRTELQRLRTEGLGFGFRQAVRAIEQAIAAA